METEYQSYDDYTPDLGITIIIIIRPRLLTLLILLDFIQRLYAREGFGNCNNTSRTHEETSIDCDDDDGHIDGRSSSFISSNEGFIPIEVLLTIIYIKCFCLFSV